jgi:hypothetical protein
MNTNTETKGNGGDAEVKSSDLFSIVDEVEKECGLYPKASFDTDEMAERIIRNELERKAKLILEKKSKITPSGEIVDETHPKGRTYIHR